MRAPVGPEGRVSTGGLGATERRSAGSRPSAAPVRRYYSDRRDPTDALIAHAQPRPSVESTPHHSARRNPPAHVSDNGLPLCRPGLPKKP